MAEDNNSTDNKNSNKKVVPIVVGTICVLGIGGFLAYNYYASTNTALILTATGSEFKNEFEDITDSNSVITSTKTILSDDYTFKIGTETDDMFVKLDYTNEINSYNALVSAYGFEYNLELGELPFNLTTKGFKYTGQSQEMIDEARTKYTSSLSSLLLTSEVSNEKSDKPFTVINDESIGNKTYDREIKFVLNKDELNTLMDSYNTEISDIVKNQLIPEIIEEVNSSIGIPLDASAIEKSFDFATGFYGSVADSGIESDIEITLYTDHKKVKELVISTVVDGQKEAVSLFFNDVNNYLNSEIVVTITSADAATGEEYLNDTTTITPLFNKDVWSVALKTSETSSGSNGTYSANYTWNLNETENNVVLTQSNGSNTNKITFTLTVDENQNIYYNKQGSLFNVVASLSSNVVAE